ncbi:MAG: M3 family oligoendopeptidase [Thermomicrobiales bacterium]
MAITFSERSDIQTPPRWDMTPYFPGLDSPEFDTALARLDASVAAFDDAVSTLPAADAAQDAVTSAFETNLGLMNDITGQGMLIGGYIYAFLSTDTRDDSAQRRYGQFQLIRARLSKASTRFTLWIGSLDTDALIAASPAASAHTFMVQQSRIAANHLMSLAEEDLAADLTLSGGSAFGRLQEDISSQITATIDRDGEPQVLPISEIRTLATDSDRAVRKAAYDAEIAAWKLWETPLAASLNGVKGEHLTVAGRRGWESPLDESLFQNSIDAETLEAMMSAARDAFPDIRRYLAAKARMLGLEKLAWYDLDAPLSATERTWSWAEAVAFINEQFGTYSARLRGLSERAFDERWIDAEPRAGKTGGAYCTEMTNGESRIMANFAPSFSEVSTLAHELGHAYHNLCLKDASPIEQRATPMTLAETASTFCETILRKAAIASGSADEQLSILEGSLQDSLAIVVDISSRFLFEQAVFARRGEGQLSADEFSALMHDAQLQTYGDAVEESTLHPYMWAVKGHYYAPDYAFYNYPYLFGLLFGLGLYAQYQADPERFRASYDDLLASTGSADAATLAARFGIDTRSTAFWTSSLDVIREDVDTFVALTDVRLRAAKA